MRPRLSSGLWVDVGVLAWTAAAGALLFSDASVALRGPVLLLFVLVCPGLGVVRLLDLGSLAFEISLAVTSSLALAGVVAGTFLYLGAWSPVAIARVLVGVTVALILLNVVLTRTGQKAERSSERT